MIKKNTLTFRIWLQGLYMVGLTEHHPCVYERALRPNNLVKRNWIPQTIADQIWIFYEFASPEDKAAYTNEAYEVLVDKGVIDEMNLSQEDINYWNQL